MANPIHGDRQFFTGSKSKGYRQCICTVEETIKKSREYPSIRIAARKKGDQCSAWVSPKQIKKMVFPICTAHEKQWERHVTEDARRRKALRDKYDPGPLYEE
jgi:hypothetical protein